MTATCRATDPEANYEMDQYTGVYYDQGYNILKVETVDAVDLPAAARKLGYFALDDLVTAAGGSMGTPHCVYFSDTRQDLHAFHVPSSGDDVFLRGVMIVQSDTVSPGDYPSRIRDHDWRAVHGGPHSRCCPNGRQVMNI